MIDGTKHYIMINSADGNTVIYVCLNSLSSSTPIVVDHEKQSISVPSINDLSVEGATRLIEALAIARSSLVMGKPDEYLGY